MDYEVVIPAAPKDYNKLPFLVKSIKEYLWPRPQRINIIHSGNINPNLLDNCYFDKISFHYEQQVINVDQKQATGFRRPQWIYQQFIKLFQDITETDDYLVIDSDLIFNKDVHIYTPFKDGDPKPYFFLGVDQNHEPYFKGSQALFGFGREYPHSFISEIMMFNKKYTGILLKIFFDHYTKSIEPNGFVVLNPTDIEETDKIEDVEKRGRERLVRSLYNVVCSLANEDFLIADYEIYGNFIYKYFPELYKIKKFKTNLLGKFSPWTDEEISNEIQKMAKTDFDVFTIHTWI